MIKLEIITPEKKVLDTDAESVTIPTASGEVGILSSHAPFVSTLKPGILAYTAKGVSEKLAVTGGFVEVNSDKVAVLTDTAERAVEIDIDAARSMRDEAERSFAAIANGPLSETKPVREQIDAANARIQLAGGR